MNYNVSKSDGFPLVEVSLQPGEEIRIERGAMAYHNGGVRIEGKMNSNGAGGAGGMLKALGRSMVSGESVFITSVIGQNPDGKIGIAPAVPGTIRELPIGAEQWCLNDSAFFACDASVGYNMKRQTIGRALFGGSGGLFVMETYGTGTMLISSFGDIMEFELDGSAPFVVDNCHVVAWSNRLSYDIKVASGTFGFTSGEGLVNEFRGTGKVLIQTRNLQSLAESVSRFIPSKN
ncbi:TIGR00266 family protein [Lachnospiraceae bacterium OttesenSCG-928-J05]|nr:TIGR00266 family protein [Lachnospiraceae bacterium OttesenSCG-928-J05]